MNDIIHALNVEMDKVATILIQFMAGEIAGMATTPELNEWKINVIQALQFRSVASAGEICKEIGILDQTNPGLMDMALSLEFGTGTKAKTSENPWYSEFLSSEYYHDSRGSMEIYSLPGEKIFDPLTNSWKMSTAENKIPMPQFSNEGSLYWSHIFGNSEIMAETYRDKGIKAAMDSIDYSKYLIVK